MACVEIEQQISFFSFSFARITEVRHIFAAQLLVIIDGQNFIFIKLGKILYIQTHMSYLIWEAKLPEG